MKRKKPPWFLLAAALAGFAAWHFFPSGPTVFRSPPPVEATPTDELLASTWNVGLAPGFVPNSDARTAAVVQETISLRDHDVVCIQEAWSEDAKAAIVEALALPEGHAFYADTRGQNENPGDVCEPDRLTKLLACVDKRCGGVDHEEMTACVQDNCLITLGWINDWAPECVQCLIASAGKPLQEAVTTCTTKGASRYHDGSNGLILFSKHPLENVEIRDMPASAANRPTIFARIKDVEVACTHMTSATDGKAPIEGRFKTWAEEQINQLTIISDRLAERAAGRPQILIGDLNIGPPLDPPHIKAYSEEAWKAFLDKGFRSPVADLRPPICSICYDNPIRDCGHGGIIDHAAFRDPPGGAGLEPLGSGHFATRGVHIVNTKGQTVETSLSDHYGITTRFRIISK